MTLTEAIRELKQDPDFCRGVRRGVGLILAAFVVSQILGCALYPLVARIGTRLTLGWACIVIGYLGMTAHLLVTAHWLWYLLRREKQPFWKWLRACMCNTEEY